MRDPEEALTTAYFMCLQGKIKVKGQPVPVYVKAVPPGVPAPYICIAEVSITPGTNAFASFGCATLLDIVTEYDNDLYRFSDASRIGALVMELTEKGPLNTAINSRVLSAELTADDVQLVTPSGKPNNLDGAWDINRHSFQTSDSLLEERDSKLVNRRLIRLRDLIYSI